jgi:hypothetical protein
VHVRILAGVGAWLLGAGTATAGSLLAVSLLGQGIAASPGQQLTADAVNRALAREAHDAGQAATGTVPPSVRTPPVTSPAATSPAASPAAPAPPAPPAPSAQSAPSAPSAPSTPSAMAAAPAVPAAAPPAGTLLTSLGGSVVAECWPAGAYLVSWSPVQGYQADDVIRGPVTIARVVFESTANSVTMKVSCPDGAAGAPVASSSIQPWGGGTDE